MKERRKGLSAAPDDMQKREDPTGMLELDGAARGYRQTLRIVIAISGAMFALETIAGYLWDSHTLRADALDFLDDALIYALSLAVIGVDTRTRLAVALCKAGIMCAMSLLVLGSALFHIFTPELPRADVIGAVGVLGLASNLTCLVLLSVHRTGQQNLRADGTAPRPDIAGNITVIVTAGAVWLFDSAWPDLIVAIAACLQMLKSNAPVMRRTVQTYCSSRR